MRQIVKKIGVRKTINTTWPAIFSCLCLIFVTFPVLAQTQYPWEQNDPADNPKLFFVWNNFVIHASSEWYKDIENSNEIMLILKTFDISAFELVALKEVDAINKEEKDVALEEIYKSFKNNPDYSYTTFHKQSKYTVLGNKKCPVVIANDDESKSYTFLPYRKGKLYMILVYSDMNEQTLSPRVEKLLEGISLIGDK